eukprot:6462784-Amphidinium_carterae.1
MLKPGIATSQDQSLSSRLSTLTENMFKIGGFPVLKAKAHLCLKQPLAQDIPHSASIGPQPHFSFCGIKYEGLIIKLVQQSQLMDKILDDQRESFRLSGRAAQTFSTAVMNYNLFFTALRRKGLNDATVLSPRLTWSHSAEDFTQATVPRYTMLSSTLCKYTCALELDLQSAKLL